MSTTASMRPALSGPIYKHSGCGAAAKMKFPNDQEGRKQFKHGVRSSETHKAAHPD
jgi:hypothetical protein